MATSERAAGSFWSWLFGYRVLWVLVFGLPTLELADALLPSVQFLADARPVRGHVEAYGVDLEEVGLSGRYVGPWSQPNPAPWIDVMSVGRDEVVMRCRLAGQLAVFGTWVSDDRDVVRVELRKRVQSWKAGIAFHRSDRLRHCAVGLDIGLDRALIFLPFLALTIGFLVATVRALCNRFSGRSSA